MSDYHFDIVDIISNCQNNKLTKEIKYDFVKSVLEKVYQEGKLKGSVEMGDHIIKHMQKGQ